METILNQGNVMLYHIRFHLFSFINIYLSGSVNRIFGRGPKILLSSYIEEYLKFETSSRSFKVKIIEKLEIHFFGIFRDISCIS